MAFPAAESVADACRSPVGIARRYHRPTIRTGGGEMKTTNVPLIAGLVIGAMAGLVLATSQPTAHTASRDGVTKQLKRLVTREQILELMSTYGATLDRRDFPAFGKLFA